MKAIGVIITVLTQCEQEGKFVFNGVSEKSCNGGGILPHSGPQQSTHGVQQTAECDQSENLVQQTGRGTLQCLRIRVLDNDS